MHHLLLLYPELAGRDGQERERCNRHQRIDEVVLCKEVRELGDEEGDHPCPAADPGVPLMGAGDKKEQKRDRRDEDQIFDHSHRIDAEVSYAFLYRHLHTGIFRPLTKS